MRLKHLAMIAAIAVAPQAIASAQAQAIMNAPEGAQLRRVAAAQDQGHLVYEYQTPAGVSRLRIDPASLVNDIERSRKRASQKKAAVKTAPEPARAAAPEPQKQAEMAQAEAPAPVASVAPTERREDRKVRIIPLYNVPKVD